MMHSFELAASQRAATLRAGNKYFCGRIEPISALALPCSSAAPAYDLADVTLPDWAADLGVGDRCTLAVDAACLVPGHGEPFERCDWLRAAALHLEGWLERSIESDRGPIHSYALRLPQRWSRAYDHAWVNRIFLFLRRWAARRTGQTEDSLFGPRPRAAFVLTHDVDALEKTPAIRIKRIVVDTVAAARLALASRWRDAAARVGAGTRFALTPADYWLFDDVCALEASFGYRSLFLFADRGEGRRRPVAWLLDPGYRIDDPRVTGLMRKLIGNGWEVGVHPGIGSWKDAVAQASIVRSATQSSGQNVELCRQHWLRFSWQDTWAAQAAAGIKIDFTLGFNDRPGFRNGAALRYHPWNSGAAAPHSIESVPTILMDSHFYDYAYPADPGAAMQPWIDEVVAVGGEASLLWHVHTMHQEYGWADGYRRLLDLLKQRQARVVAAGGS